MPYDVVERLVVDIADAMSVRQWTIRVVEHITGVVVVLRRRGWLSQALLPSARRSNYNADVTIGMHVIIGRVSRGNAHVHHTHPVIFEDKVMARFLESGNGLHVFRSTLRDGDLCQGSSQENRSYKSH
ncbi:MAG TPA: hypothetical protein VH207_08825 [Chthoniobacterales bacterium]|nr:hypothetical protein [Chthoniobacterales bacterium]